MMPSLRSFDDLDGKERGQKKTDDLRTMTTLGPRTLAQNTKQFRRLVLENRITVSNFLFGRKGILWA